MGMVSPAVSKNGRVKRKCQTTVLRFEKMVEMSKKYFEILEMSKNDSKLSYDSQK